MNALLLATAMAVAPAQAAPNEVAPTEAAPTHEVLTGESLSMIALCELGDSGRWGELFELNEGQITDPDIIEAGWTIVLPEGASGDCPTEPVVEAASATAPQTASPEATPEAETPVATPEAATPEPEAPAPEPEVSETSSGDGLADIRACESGGDYGAVSANGQYRGAYQFDQQTWESVGGSGDPADASPAEQDQRAAALQQQRGSSPWPSCG